MKNKKRIKKVVNQIHAVKKQHQGDSSDQKNSNLNYPHGEYTEGIGRRKVATARVRIYKSKGDFIVNDQLAEDYFSSVPLADKIYNLPFAVTKTEGDFAVTARVEGSGIKAQTDAVAHGLSRALEAYDPKLRPFLKEQGLLTRDPRMKETRKPGRGGKARRKRQSPKR